MTKLDQQEKIELCLIMQQLYVSGKYNKNASSLKKEEDLNFYTEKLIKLVESILNK